MSLHKIIEISLTGITEILKAEIWSNLQDDQRGSNADLCYKSNNQIFHL
jgi:hypothetical protein